MLEFTNLTESQTYRLLRKLKERGYLVQVELGGGQRHFSGYHIPLDAKGDISPQPPCAGQLPTRRWRKLAKTTLVPLNGAAPDPETPIPETPQPEEEIDDQAADYIGGYTPRPVAAIPPSVVVAEVTLEEMIATAEEIVAARELQLANTKNAAGRRIMEKQVAKARADLQELQAQAFIQQGGYVT